MKSVRLFRILYSVFYMPPLTKEYLKKSILNLTKKLHPLDIYYLFETYRKGIYTEADLHHAFQRKDNFKVNMIDMASIDPLDFLGIKFDRTWLPYFLEIIALYDRKVLPKESGLSFGDGIQDLKALIKNLNLVWRKNIVPPSQFPSGKESYCQNRFFAIMATEEVKDFHIAYRISSITSYGLLDKYEDIKSIISTFFKYVSYILFLPTSYESLTLDQLSKHCSLSKDDLLSMMRYVGLADYEEYKKRVKANGEEHYFYDNELKNCFLIPLEIEKTPFLFHNNLGMIGYECPLYNKYSLLQSRIITTVGGDDFGNIVVDYMEKMMQHSFGESSNYIFDKNQKYKNKSSGLEGDVDFYVYNKSSKSIVFFEVKVRNELGRDMYKKGNLKYQTSAGGLIVKGIDQLLKVHNNIDFIEKRLSLSIDKSKVLYVFLNYHSVAFWNHIVRHFFTKNSKGKIDNSFIYKFLSLCDFECLIMLCKNYGVDIYDGIVETCLFTVNSPIFDQNHLDYFKAMDHPNSFQYIESDFKSYLDYNYTNGKVNIDPFSGNIDIIRQMRY